MLPKVLKNFNLFVDGRGYAGRVQDVTLPKLTLQTEAFRMGGLDTPVQVDVGLEPLEVAMTLSEYDPYIIKLFGIADRRDAVGNGPARLTLRGGLSDEIENKTIPVVIHCEGSVLELDFGQWRAGEHAPLNIRVALRYYRLTINDEELVEIDVENRIRKIGSHDQLRTG